MPLLTVNNLTSEVLALQEKTGEYGGLVLRVPASGSVSNVYVMLQTLASLEPTLQAQATAGNLTWSTSVDPAFESDQIPSHITTVLVTPYDAVAGDQIILTNLTSAGAVSVVLSAAAPIGQEVHVVDAKGDAGTNHITITVASSGTINGGANDVISSNNGHVALLKTGASAWTIIG
jgi:hypothetical protein